MSADPAPPPFHPIDRSQHEVLVVDDDPVSRYSTARQLRAAGFRTREAATGAEGLAMADAGISAVVLDVHLPDIDGFELCRRLRTQEATARMPVLHLSAAYVKDEDKVRGLDSGADAYLTHPVEPAVLVATVQAVVRARVAEEAMRDSEVKFKAIYTQVPGGIGLIAVDDAGVPRFVDANPALLKLLDRPLAQVVGRTLEDFVAPALAAQAGAFMRGTAVDQSEGATAGRGDVVRDEFAVLDRQGRAITIGWSLAPRVQPGLGMVLATDLSERTLLEEQRQAAFERERLARAEAERLSHMKDELIAVLSHELRTPLTAITGWTHVLRKRSGDAQTLARALDAIERSTKLQATLISDLLDMSQLNVGKMRLDLQSLDPVALAESAVLGSRAAAEANDSAVQLVVVDPPCAHIRADSSRVLQILSNLLGNAIKFSPRGAPVTLELRTQTDARVPSQGEGLLLSVIDQGRGITPEFLPLLFDRFSQADAGSNRQRGGLGLGLSIVRQLVEAHGGHISASSAGLGQGARFDVWLPCDPATTDAGRAGDADRLDSDEHESPLRGLDLLVVDDDPEVCAMLQIILGDRGARVRTGHDYESALAQLAQGAPDVLISDVGMPGKDGYALIQELRRREAAGGSGAHVPAIALTSFTRAQDQAQAASAGFDLHSPKPIKPLHLLQQIAQLARAASGGNTSG